MAALTIVVHFTELVVARRIDVSSNPVLASMNDLGRPRCCSASTSPRRRLFFGLSSSVRGARRSAAGDGSCGSCGLRDRAARWTCAALIGPVSRQGGSKAGRCRRVNWTCFRRMYVVDRDRVRTRRAGGVRLLAFGAEHGHGHGTASGADTGCGAAGSRLGLGLGLGLGLAERSGARRPPYFVASGKISRPASIVILPGRYSRSRCAPDTPPSVRHAGYELATDEEGRLRRRIRRSGREVASTVLVNRSRARPIVHEVERARCTRAGACRRP